MQIPSWLLFASTPKLDLALVPTTVSASLGQYINDRHTLRASPIADVLRTAMRSRSTDCVELAPCLHRCGSSSRRRRAGAVRRSRTAVTDPQPVGRLESTTLEALTGSRDR